MRDDRTAQNSLPLPHPDNDLGDDVLRLRAALQGIDTLLAAAQAALLEKSDTADVQRLAQSMASANQALQERVEALTAQKVGRVNGKTGPEVQLSPADLALVPNRPTDGAASAALTRDAQGRITRVAFVLQGQAGSSTLSYGAQGIERVQTEWGGQAASVTFARDAAGRVTKIERTQA